MALNAPVIRGLYQLPDTNAIAYAAAIVAAGAGASWLAHQLASAMLRQRDAAVAATSDSQSIRPIISFGVLAAFLVFIVVFIATASPPV